MRRNLLLLALACGLSAQAQTLCVWNLNRNLGTLYDANTHQTPMRFEGNDLVIDGNRHEVDPALYATVSTQYDKYLEKPDMVYVCYGANAQPKVYAPGNVAPYLKVSTIFFDGTSDVFVTVDDAMERELTFVLSGAGSSFYLKGNYKTSIVLDGVELKAVGEQPALWIDNGKRIEIKVSDGTSNTFADAAANQKKSAFYVKGHAEWKGGGTVSIAGTSRHAYSSGEYTQFKSSFSGTFNVTGAGSDGMHVEQYLEINGGTFNIAGNKGDGIDVSYALEDDEVTPTKDEKNGQFIMNGGTITVEAASADTKGVKCEDKMTITAGRINATATGDGSRGVSAGTDLYLGAEDATDLSAAYIYVTASGNEYTDPATGDASKCRGLKVKQNFYHYPSTLERDANSVIGKKKIVDVDGTYFGLGGKLVNITIE